MNRFLLSFFCLFSFFSFSYNSQNLRVKDYEQMKSLVSKHIKESRSHESLDSDNNITNSQTEALDTLTKALAIVLMRPDTDNFMNFLLSPLVEEINNYKSFILVLSDFVEKSAQQFKASSKADEQTNLFYILENSMRYAKTFPDPIADSIFKTIEVSRIKTSKSLKSYLFLNIGKTVERHPYLTAKRILKARLKDRKTQALQTSPNFKKIKKSKNFFQKLFGL